MRIAVDVLPISTAGVGRWQRETILELSQRIGTQLNSLSVFSLGNRYRRPDWVPTNVRFREAWIPGRIQTALIHSIGFPVEQVCGVREADVILGMNLHPLRSSRPIVMAVADVSWRSFAGQYRTTFNSSQITRAEEAIRKASHILTLSRYSADELMRGGVSSSCITVAHLGVQNDFTRVSEDDVSRVRTHYQLPEAFVLYVGGINERKNLPVLVKAINLLEGSVPLVIAGPPPTESHSFWGLDQPGIRHLGYIPDLDIPPLYAAARLKVFPSKLEGYGLPLIEAMAVGTPVLAADTPVFREVAEDAACFFPPDDPVELSRLIRTAFDSANFRNEYQGRGYQLATRRTWTEYGNHLVEALRAGTRSANKYHRNRL